MIPVILLFHHLGMLIAQWNRINSSKHFEPHIILQCSVRRRWYTHLRYSNSKWMCRYMNTNAWCAMQCPSVRSRRRGIVQICSLNICGDGITPIPKHNGHNEMMHYLQIDICNIFRIWNASVDYHYVVFTVCFQTHIHMWCIKHKEHTSHMYLHVQCAYRVVKFLVWSHYVLPFIGNMHTLHTHTHTCNIHTISTHT